eukprot:gene5323-3825_t
MYRFTKERGLALQSLEIHKIVAIAFFLGVLTAVCFFGLYISIRTQNSNVFAFSVYMLAVHVVFHSSEFIVAAWMRPHDTSISSFMILHSPAYLAASSLSILEFFLKALFFSESWLQPTFALSSVFAVLTLAFYSARIIAMIQCGRNFSLLIEEEKRNDHQLVTHGLYSFLRHPAYFAWFWRTLFAQLILCNGVSVVVHTAVTWKFLKDRIACEERILESENFFGVKYKEYKSCPLLLVSSAQKKKRREKLLPIALPEHLGDIGTMNYLVSLHYTPLIVGSAACSVLYASGHSILAGTTLVSTLLGTAVVFWCQPLRARRAPKNRRYDVGILELDHDDERGVPPITVFYPTKKDGNGLKDVSWLPYKDSRYLKGMARYAKMPYILFRDLRHVTVEVSASRSLPPLATAKGARPIILFSHGLSGYSRLYTTMFLHLASQGAIVFSVTHTDRSAAFCRDSTNTLFITIDTKLKLTSEDRQEQFLKRSEELCLAHARIADGKLLLGLGYTTEEVVQFNSLYGRIHLMGHSFGGASALNSAFSLRDHPRAGSVICLDPWHVPLQGVLQKGLLNIEKKSFATPALLLFSQEWCLMEGALEFFERLDQEYCDRPGRLLIRRYDGTDHLSCCDISVFTRVGKQAYCVTNPERQIQEWAHEILQFISQQNCLYNKNKNKNSLFKKKLSFSNTLSRSLVN